MNTRKLVVCISGPTGIGKTEVGLKLAKLLDGEILSCDSVQIYKGLRIGANKFEPGHEDPPQHLVDILDLNRGFSAADFIELCRKMIQSVLLRHKTPILVGGTGLYFDWLVNGRPSARKVSEPMLSKIGELVKGDPSWESSLERLRGVDPIYAKSILRNDYYRLVKAIGFYQEFGYPLSSCPRVKRSDDEWEWRCVYLTAQREHIYRTIDRRCELMVQQGLVSETYGLLREGLLLRDSIAGRSIGYKETLDFIEKVAKNEKPDIYAPFLEYLDAFTAATRQYARKQETWFSNKFEDQFVWVYRTNDTDHLVDKICEYCISSEHDSFLRESEEIRGHLRSATEKEKRRKTFRTYTPQYTIFHDQTEIVKVLSDIIK